MVVRYFDTSAIVRYYHAEPGSAQVEAMMHEAGSLQVVSWLAVIETQSAFALKVRTGEVSDGDFLALRK